MAGPLQSQSHLFDIPGDVAYLNCAYMPPLPRTVRDAGRRFLDDSTPWGITPRDFFEPGDRLRIAVAELIGGDADGVAFVPSVSYGIGVAARNLTVGPGRTVVMLDEGSPPTCTRSGRSWLQRVASSL